MFLHEDLEETIYLQKFGDFVHNNKYFISRKNHFMNQNKVCANGTRSLTMDMIS